MGRMRFAGTNAILLRMGCANVPTGLDWAMAIRRDECDTPSDGLRQRPYGVGRWQFANGIMGWGLIRCGCDVDRPPVAAKGDPQQGWGHKGCENHHHDNRCIERTGQNAAG
jgi:hypothetical protein